MPLGKPVQGLSGHKLLCDLPFERDAVGTLSGHGFHPLKAQLPICQFTCLCLSGSGVSGITHSRECPLLTDFVAEVGDDRCVATGANFFK